MRMDALCSARTSAMLLAAAVLGACGTSNSAPRSERLIAEQFASVNASPVAGAGPSVGPTPPPAGAPTSEPDVTGATQVRTPPAGSVAASAPTDTLALRSFIGEPDVSATPASAVDTPIVLESVVGQINGRPLFASEVLTPLDGKLRALAAQVNNNRAQFARGATNDIIQVVTNKVRDELILAEAQASLPPEVRQGLFAFLGRIQKNLVSAQSGSELQADEALRESTGQTLQQASRDRLERELIGNELRTKILPRVNVPWRLIRQEYDRNFDKYNPAGAATLRVISVPLADANAVRRAEEAIATKPFAEAAAMDFNAFLRSEGGLAQRELDRPYEQSPLFANEAMTIAAQKLSEGQTSPPVKWNDNLAWIHLESIDPGEAVTLYDAQLDIESDLRDRKFNQERNIYFERLLARGSFTRIESMVEESVAIAIERYLPPQAQ